MPAWLSGFLGAVLGGLVSIITTLANNRHQARLEAGRAAAAKELEATKAALGNVAKGAERRATVASDTLLACLDLLEAMEAAASVTRIVCDPVDQPDEDARERRRRTVAARWNWLGKYDSRFDRAYVMAQVYLPDAACDALERIRKLKWSIHVDQQAHAELMGQGHRDSEKFFRGGYGSVPTKQIDALREELRSLLRPLAQLA